MKRILTAAALAVGLVSGANAATIANGSFENPGSFQGNFTTYGAGSTAITGWSIDRGSVDLINTFWQHSDQNYSINLDGASPATMSTTMSGLEVGKTYRVSFDMAANTSDPNSQVGLTASAGQSSQSYVFENLPSLSRSNMGWETYTLAFTATTEDMALSFASDSRSGPYGAALDNVSISAVPLPASGLLLLGAFGALAMRGRKKA